jgi:hypothetical protein
MDAAKSEKIMMGLRPRTSDIDPTNNMLMAIEIVATERDKLDIAGEILNSLESSGSKGCVQYKIAKVVKPPAKKAMFVLRNTGVPC